MREWLTEDGLMKLDPEDTNLVTLPSGETVVTVRNDNGILWLAYWHFLADVEFTTDQYEHIKRYIGGTDVTTFIRKPGDYRRNSKDNLIAIYALRAMGGTRPMLFDNEGMTTQFMRNGWNIPPGRVEPGSRIIQGGDIAWFKVMTGFKPTLWESVWFCIGLLINAFQPQTRVSEHCLAWLRIEALGYGFEKPWYWNTVIEIWKWRYESKGAEEFFFRAFFRDDHPIQDVI